MGCVTINCVKTIEKKFSTLQSSMNRVKQLEKLIFVLFFDISKHIKWEDVFSNNLIFQKLRNLPSFKPY